MGKIVRVESRTVVVPLAAATSFARRSVNVRHYSLLRVTDADGHQGIGFCYAGSFGGGIVTAALREIAPMVVGDDSGRVRGIWDQLYRELILHGRAGSVMRAMSVLDIALWDLNARAANLPLWRYLGATDVATVPAYASGGYYLDGKTPQDLADEARSYLAQGFTAVKIKVGRASPGGDAARAAAVRAAIGPDTLLMMDANNAWADLPTAQRHLRALEPYDPYWIEEPFGPDDVDNHARLAARTSVPVATGEIEQGRWRHKALLDAGAAAILQTDAAVCGGITEFLRIAAMAEGYGVSIAPHWFHDLHVHLVAATSNATVVEFFPDEKVFNFRRLIDTQLATDGHGNLRLPQGPGLGFDFDPTALRAYAADEWA